MTFPSGPFLLQQPVGEGCYYSLLLNQNLVLEAAGLQERLQNKSIYAK